MTQINKKIALGVFEEQLSELSILNGIALNMKLIYCGAKVEKALQEVVESNYLYSTPYVIGLERCYNDLLLYGLLCLQLEGIKINDLFDDLELQLSDNDIYSLAEYSIKKFENPLSKIYDRTFKATLKSILTDVVESPYFEKCKKRSPWK